MLENLRKKIGHYLLKRKFIRKNSEPVSFNKIISGSFDFFVVMPKEDQDFYQALELIRFFQIHKKRITLFLPDFKYNLIPEKEKYGHISYQPDQITKFFLPAHSLVSTIGKKEYDVVLDFNRTEDIFCSAAANIPRAKVRAGFSKLNSDGYYNLQFNGKAGGAEVTYRNFLRFLQLF